MAFKIFAKLDSNNVVINAITVEDYIASTEEEFITWLTNRYGWSNWRETFKDGSKRLNYATDQQWRYDSSLDAFVEAKPPYPSWVNLNTTTGKYDPPVPMPITWIDEVNKVPYLYKWDEATLSWVG